MELKNKVAVITGGSRGLGKAIGAGFVQEGAKVIICARSEEEVGQAAREIGATPFVADVTREQDLISLANFVIKEFGSIDIWINNAGTTHPHSSIEEIDMKRAHEVMEVNLFGTMYGSRAALSIMKKQKQGAIVNILSTSALIGRPRSASYAASKWAARGFTESLRLATESDHILVIAVHPDGIKTDFFGTQRPADYDTRMEPEFVARMIIENLKKDSPDQEVIIKNK